MWLIALAAGLAGLILWKRREIARLLAVLTLFSEKRIVGNFSAMNRAFVTIPLSRGGGPVSPLPPGDPLVLPPEIESWIAARAVTALVVLKEGRLVHESCHLGTGAEDLRISWSVAKSFLSALYGILLEEGAAGAPEDPVIRHVPALKGTAYEGARVIDVLRMASGVRFDEDYMAFRSDINRMGRVLALGGSMDRFAASLRERWARPGAAWQYVSIDTHVIGMVIRGATGRDVPELMEEKLLIPMGLEAAPYYIADRHGVAFVLGGLNMRTRDYARFGQMFAQRGFWNGRQIVPESWVLRSTRASAPTAPGQTRYGLQWWVPEGEYFARGIYGQHVFVNEAEQLVIAVNAADRAFREDHVEAENLAAFRRIAAAARA